jgi:glc operon protein GlcG
VTVLSVEHALELVRRVHHEAAEQSLPVAVVVVDQGGHLVAAARSSSLGFVATDFARRKAIASATFGASTQSLSESFGQDPLLPGAFTGSPDVSLLPGGFPVVVDGACVGGMGISGGHYSQDHAVGAAALA